MASSSGAWLGGEEAQPTAGGEEAEVASDNANPPIAAAEDVELYRMGKAATPRPSRITAT